MTQPRDKKTSRRSSPRSSGSSSNPGNGSATFTGPGDQSDGLPAPQGVRVEHLDPRIIEWPEVRITSEYDQEQAEALRRSMAELGQQDAVGVIQLEDGTFEGASGMNRCMGAIELGSETILCVVRPGSHRDGVVANLATSINQSRANPLSEVEGIANARFVEGLGIDELARITGMSPDWVEERILISKAGDMVLQCLGDRRIAIGHAGLLARVEDPAARDEALTMVLRHRWSVAELTEFLRGPGESSGPRTPRQPRQVGPKRCHFCEPEHDAAKVQTLTVCNDCVPRIATLAVGEVPVAVVLMREAETALAASPETAPLAEQIATLLEAVGSEPEPELVEP